jgi:hypothetical protein
MTIITMAENHAPKARITLRVNPDVAEQLETLVPYHQRSEYVSRLIRNAHALAEKDKIAHRLRTIADKLQNI